MDRDAVIGADAEFAHGDIWSPDDELRVEVGALDEHSISGCHGFGDGQGLVITGAVVEHVRTVGRTVEINLPVKIPASVEHVGAVSRRIAYEGDLTVEIATGVEHACAFPAVFGNRKCLHYL